MAKKTKKKQSKSEELDCKSSCCNEGSCSGVYFLGFIGAVIYYISNATGFWNGVWGFIKALLWPAFLVFEIFKYLGM